MARVQTVLGDVSPQALGKTLPHEHFAIDFSHFYTRPPTQLEHEFTSNAIYIENCGNIRQYPHSLKYNLVFNDRDANEAVLEDVKLYKRFGGGTIVENSTEGLKRDAAFTKRVSKETGVHVVLGTGYYISDMQNQSRLSETKENLYSHMLHELTVGCFDCKDVKAGVMGEIASVWPIKDLERKAIVAAGELQEQVGCGVTFHPHRVPEAPFEIMRVYLEAGGKADKCVMSHLDRTLLQTDRLLEFAELGGYCQFDLFGLECSYYQLNSATDMPSDAQRLDKLKMLVDEGFEDRLLMSHDIHTKHRLTKFGGHGYSHIINNVIPRMEPRGFTAEVIDKITVKNPAKWLTIDK